MEQNNLFNQRDQKKVNCEDQCLELMEANTEMFCGDNLHALAIYMIHKEFGVAITTEIIQRFATIDRSKRKVMERHPHLDLRMKSDALEANDKKYYKEN